MHAQIAGGGTVNPISAALLNYIPLPNAPGTKNFVYSTSGLSDSTNIAFRIMHSFGAPAPGKNNPLRRNGRNSINFGLNYTNANSDLIRPFRASPVPQIHKASMPTPA